MNDKLIVSGFHVPRKKQVQISAASALSELVSQCLILPIELLIFLEMPNFRIFLLTTCRDI
jgi:hypothetical protein